MSRTSTRANTLQATGWRELCLLAMCAAVEGGCCFAVRMGEHTCSTALRLPCGAAEQPDPHIPSLPSDLSAVAASSCSRCTRRRCMWWQRRGILRWQKCCSRQVGGRDGVGACEPVGCQSLCLTLLWRMPTVLAGADPSCTDFDGKTPLHNALEMGVRPLGC